MTRGTPLAGRRVLVTRAEGQADEMVELFEEAGAKVVHLPVIRFEPPPGWQSLDEVLDTLDSFHWMIFTSTNGVKFFMQRLSEKGLDTMSLSHLKIAAVGPATADALRENGIEATAVPRQFRGAELATLLPDNQHDVRTVLVRALEGREEIVDALQARGGSVHVAIAYETKTLDHLPDEIRSQLLDGSIDTLTFTSPSTARGLLDLLTADERSALARRARFVSIGPTTSAALRDLGVSEVHEAAESTAQGLVAAAIEAGG